MKKLIGILMLVFSVSGFGQNDSIRKTYSSVVAADKMNIVYRGVSNPISIAVKDAKSFTATGIGLYFEKEKYIMRPGQGLETKILVNIIKNDNTEIIEEHIFRIKGIQTPIGKINGQNCYSCIIQMTKSQLANAEISIDVEDFAFEMELKLKSFNVQFRNKKNVVVQGSRFTPEVLSEINKLKKGNTFIISEIAPDWGNTDGYLLPKVYPIKIMIVDERIPIRPTRKAMRDSLHETRKSIKMQKKLLKKHGYNTTITKIKNPTFQ